MIRLEIGSAMNHMGYVLTQAGANLTLQYVNPPPSNGIVFRLVDLNEGTSGCGAPGHTYARTTAEYHSQPGARIGAIDRAYVNFNREFTDWTSEIALTVAYHEIGHALGVGHVYNVSPGACPDPGSDRPLMYPEVACSDRPAPDGLLIKALQCLYGSSGSPLEGVEFKALDVWGNVRIKRSSCWGSPSCYGPTTVSRQNSRYDLSISEDGGPFVHFASLTDETWIDNVYEHAFAESHPNARIKMEVWDGETLVGTPISDAADIFMSSAVEIGRDDTEMSVKVGHNPFSLSTELWVEHHRSERVAIAIVDITGRVVRRLFDGVLPGGRQRFVWNGLNDVGRSTSSGMYFVRVLGRSTRAIATMVKLK